MVARSCPHCWTCPGGQCGVGNAAGAGGHPGPLGLSHASLHHLSPSHSRTQPASTSKPLPYPQIRVLDQCELLSWLWKTPQPVSPLLGQRRKEGEPCVSHHGLGFIAAGAVGTWGKFFLGLSLQPTLTSSPLSFSCVVSFCAAVHKRCKQQPVKTCK